MVKAFSNVCFLNLLFNYAPSFLFFFFSTKRPSNPQHAGQEASKIDQGKIFLKRGQKAQPPSFCKQTTF
jgi:hypothetical protein